MKTASGCAIFRKTLFESNYQSLLRLLEENYDACKNELKDAIKGRNSIDFEPSYRRENMEIFVIKRGDITDVGSNIIFSFTSWKYLHIFKIENVFRFVKIFSEF